MRKIAEAVDDGNIDEDEQREIEEAELQVYWHLHIRPFIIANVR